MHERRCRSLLLSTLVVPMLVAAWARPAGAQPLSQSPEFQINTYTSLNQQSAAVAADSQGGFVVVWEQLDGGAVPDTIVGRRFDSSGTGLDVDFQINVFTLGLQRSPAVGNSGAGGFVVVWTSAGQDGDNYGVFGRRFDSSGNALAAEFQVTSYTSNGQSFPRVAMSSGGDFVVVWQSVAQDGSNAGVFGRRFDSAGSAVAAEFQANVYTVDDQQGPNVFLKSDGSFIVAWSSDLQDGSLGGAFGRRFSSSGTPIGGEFQINAYTTAIQVFGSLAYNASGGFVALWGSQQQDGSDFGIFGRRFDSSALPIGSEFQANAYTTEDQTQPAVVSSGNGAFVVVWSSYAQDGDDMYGLRARAFSSEAQPRGGEIAVNTTTLNSQRSARIAATGQRFVVVWQSGLQDGSNNGVFARRFLVPLTLDVDGDGQVLPLTDALLILRYTFGFRGSTLLTGAVGLSCTRCDAPSIEAYLAEV